MALTPMLIQGLVAQLLDDMTRLQQTMTALVEAVQPLYQQPQSPPSPSPQQPPGLAPFSNQAGIPCHATGCTGRMVRREVKTKPGLPPFWGCTRWSPKGGCTAKRDYYTGEIIK
jgi:hypothetical protein